MKVLHVSSAKTFRGGERQIVNLISHLDKRDIEHYLYCPTGSELSSFKINNLSGKECYLKVSPLNFLVPVQLKKLVAKYGINLVHAHDPHGLQYSYFSKKYLNNNVKLISTRRVSYPVRKTSLRFYNDGTSDKTICISPSVKKAMLQSGVEEKNLKVIASGFAGLPINNISLRDLLDLESTSKLIVNLGALSKQKDHITFVKTAKHFLDRAKGDFHFVIIGKDEGEMNPVRSLIKQYGLEDRIHLTGYIEHASHCLYEADILLSTSISEGLGNSVLESFAAKVPVVATSCEGTVDIVQHGSNGMLASAGNHENLAACLKELFDNDELRNKLTTGGTQTLRRFNMDNVATAIYDLYTDILKL